MGVFTPTEYRKLGNKGIKINRGGYYRDPKTGYKHYNYYIDKTIYWGGMDDLGLGQNYDEVPYLASLAHEMEHAYYECFLSQIPNMPTWEKMAMWRENKARYAYYKYNITTFDVYPRMSYTSGARGLGPTVQDAWRQYLPWNVVYP